MPCYDLGYCRLLLVPGTGTPTCNAVFYSEDMLCKDASILS